MENTTTKFLGTTDDVTTCECCGRSDLKSTVALSFDGADPVYYGVVCASYALKVSAKEVRKGAREADAAKVATERAVRQAQFDAEYNALQAWLDSKSSKTNRFAQLEELGGYKAAYEAFKAHMAGAS